MDSVTVHDCPKCRGIWFEGDELSRAKDEAAPHLRWLDLDVFEAAKANSQPGSKLCPECGKAMAVLVYPHSKVKMDVCASDPGVWLERGDFDEIMKALEHVANSLSAREYEQAAVEQLKEVISGPESHMSEIRDFLAVFRALKRRIGVEHAGLADALNKMSQAGL